MVVKVHVVDEPCNQFDDSQHAGARADRADNQATFGDGITAGCCQLTSCVWEMSISTAGHQRFSARHQRNSSTGPSSSRPSSPNRPPRELVRITGHEKATGISRSADSRAGRRPRASRKRRRKRPAKNNPAASEKPARGSRALSAPGLTQSMVFYRPAPRRTVYFRVTIKRHVGRPSLRLDCRCVGHAALAAGRRNRSASGTVSERDAVKSRLLRQAHGAVQRCQPSSERPVRVAIPGSPRIFSGGHI